MDFIVLINLPGNENFLEGDKYFGGFMTLAYLLIIPLYPPSHLVRLSVGLWSGEGREFLWPVLAFLITFILALWVSKFFIQPSTKLNAESGEQ